MADVCGVRHGEPSGSGTAPQALTGVGVQAARGGKRAVDQGRIRASGRPSQPRQAEPCWPELTADHVSHSSADSGRGLTQQDIHDTLDLETGASAIDSRAGRTKSPWTQPTPRLAVARRRHRACAAPMRSWFHSMPATAELAAGASPGLSSLGWLGPLLGPSRMGRFPSGPLLLVLAATSTLGV